MAKLSYGSFYFSATALTTLSAATPAKAAGTTTAGELPADAQFAHANNRLTYAGSVTRDFVVIADVIVSKTTGTAGVVTVHIAKNGSSVLNRTYDLAQDVVLGSGGAVFFDDINVPYVIAGTIQLADTDYLEIWLETDNGDDATVMEGGLTVKVAG